MKHRKKDNVTEGEEGVIRRAIPRCGEEALDPVYGYQEAERYRDWREWVRENDLRWDS